MTLRDGAYLLATALFVLGLRRLSTVRSAEAGNRLSALGMLVAVVAALVGRGAIGLPWVLGALALGSAAGALLALRVRITAMPEMVGLLNGLGGGASMAVAIAEHGSGEPVSVLLGALVGAVTLTGSLVAFGKLAGIVESRPVLFPGIRPATALLLLALLALAWGAGKAALFHLFWAGSCVLGLLLVLPIGGGDMPVVISLLNSYSGLAASLAGFVLRDRLLIVTGALVGASGILLTRLMCRAMNRPLANVVFGAFGRVAAAGGARGEETRVARATTAEDAAILLSSARLVIVVPGYGLAVARAQHALRELCDLLLARGVEVKYAIHPVAGRMPGHMNVLLAEADVPYDRLFELDAVNADFERADVALVVGANDVVNPAARSDPASPIHGMPILDADRARAVLVLKRGSGPGFAGIENELFLLDRTRMLYGDAAKTLQALVAAVKSA